MPFDVIFYPTLLKTPSTHTFQMIIYGADVVFQSEGRTHAVYDRDAPRRWLSLYHSVIVGKTCPWVSHARGSEVATGGVKSNYTLSAYCWWHDSVLSLSIFLFLSFFSFYLFLFSCFDCSRARHPSVTGLCHSHITYDSDLTVSLSALGRFGSQ